MLVFNFVSDSKQSKRVHEEKKICECNHLQKYLILSKIYPRFVMSIYIWLECLQPWEYITFIIPLFLFLFVVHRRYDVNKTFKPSLLAVDVLVLSLLCYIHTNIYDMHMHMICSIMCKWQVHQTTTTLLYTFCKVSKQMKFSPLCTL